MRKDVEKHLHRANCQFLQEPQEPATCDFARLFDGFLVHVLRLDSEEYRRAFWREAYQNGHTIGHVPRTFDGFVKRNARSLDKTVSLILSVLVMFGVYAGLAILRNRLSRLIRRMRRPAYYEQERQRRLELAAERRKIRLRYTLNPRPSYDAIRTALSAARGSPEGALRCGSLMQDLECSVDNTLVFDKHGRIAGRRGGIKRLLQRDAPDLFSKYSTLMRHKAMAKRFRQTCGLADPIPADMLLEQSHTLSSRNTAVDTQPTENASSITPPSKNTSSNSPAPESMTPEAPQCCSDGGHADCAVKESSHAGGDRRVNLPELIPARNIAREIIGKCEGTIISLEAELALRLDPDCIPVPGKNCATVRMHLGGRPRVLKRAIDWLLRRSAA